MKELFELEWCGGVAAHHFRSARPEAAGLPWGSLRPDSFPAPLVDEARVFWTETILAEYRAIAAFSALLRSFAEAKVALDLIGMAGDFIADEAVHVELASRVVMELGGAAPLYVDCEALLPPEDRSLTPLQRAADLALRVSCVSETFSGATVAAALPTVTHPLTRAVYTLIARDEAKHVRLGWLFLDWLGPRLDDAERARLGAVALGALSAHAPAWNGRAIRRPLAGPGPRHRAEDLSALGWHVGGDDGSARPRAIVEREILEPLARRGITVAKRDVDGLFAPVTLAGAAGPVAAPPRE